MKATDEYESQFDMCLKHFRLPCANKEQLCRFEYLWQDSDKYKRPTKMAAPDYIEHLMSWVQSNIDNEQVFPSRIGMYPFHSHFYIPFKSIPPAAILTPFNLLVD